MKTHSEKVQTGIDDKKKTADRHQLKDSLKTIQELLDAIFSSIYTNALRFEKISRDIGSISLKNFYTLKSVIPLNTKDKQFSDLSSDSAIFSYYEIFGNEKYNLINSDEYCIRLNKSQENIAAGINVIKDLALKTSLVALYALTEASKTNEQKIPENDDRQAAMEGLIKIKAMSGKVLDKTRLSRQYIMEATRNIPGLIENFNNILKLVKELIQDNRRIEQLLLQIAESIKQFNEVAAISVIAVNKLTEFADNLQKDTKILTFLINHYNESYTEHI